MFELDDSVRGGDGEGSNDTVNTEYRCCSPRPSRLKLPHNNPVFVAEREWGAMPVG